MQSKQIHLNLSPSKMPLIGLIGIFICSYLIIRLVPGTKFIMFGLFAIICLYWLFRYLNYKKYQLIVNTSTHEIVINHKNQQVTAILTKVQYVSWWLCIMTLQIANTYTKIYLFADSAPFTEYKSFRIFSQWT